MSANDFSRQQQLAFNEAMVQQAGGLLAPLNGAERYVTVSSGHVSQLSCLEWMQQLEPREPVQGCAAEADAGGRVALVGGQLGCGGRMARSPSFGRESLECLQPSLSEPDGA